MKLRTKFSLFAIILIILVIVGVSGLFLIAEKHYLIEEAKEEQVALAKNLVQVSKESLLRSDDLFLLNYVKTIKKNNNAISYAMFVDNSNMIIAHTDPGLLRKTVSNSISLDIQTGENEIVDIAFPVIMGNEKKGTARIGFSKKVLDSKVIETLKQTRQRIFYVSSLTMVFGLIGALVFVNIMLRHIRALSKGADLISEGKLDTNIKVSSRDELGQLSERFNEMAKKLKELDEMKRDFVANITHDLRSPLSAIESYVNEMMDGSPGKPINASVENLTVIKNNAVRLSRLIDNLLDVAKIEAGRIELNLKSASIQSIIEDIVQLFKPYANNRHVKLKTQIPEFLPTVSVDEDKIRQVFTNLVSNALKFTSAEGTVTVTAEQKTISKNNFIQINVIDTGVGISEKDLSKIFDKFAQVKEKESKIKDTKQFHAEDIKLGLVSSKGKPKGTGLGLYIVKNIVELHGGKVRAESKPGKGSIFSLTLPLPSP